MTNNTAVVTGSCGFIGREIVKSLIDKDYFVYCLDLENAFLNKDFLNLKIENKSQNIPIDLSDDKSMETIKTIIDSNEKIDLLVNNAAYYGNINGFDTDFEGETIEAWNKVIKVNLIMPFFLTQTLAANLKKSQFASVVNIGTMYTEVGPNLSLYESTNMHNPASYTASKSGLLGVTRWLSTILAPSIRVNMISPGGILRGQDESFVNKYLERVPLKRFCSEKDVANLVVYLAGKESRYITGQNLLIDGGFTSW